MTAAPGGVPRTVVVTGGAGFIGTRVRLAFARAGAAVVGLDLVAAHDEAGEVRSADLGEPGGWEHHLAGADVVVHTAARVGEQGTAAQFRAANVGLTAAVLEAARAGLVGRTVHLSSITVVGPRIPDGIDERHPVRPTGNPYTDTKLVSEHLALHARAAGAPVVVVRPGDVYGPGSRQWTRRPVELLRRGLLVLPDGGRGVLDPVYVDDLAAGIVAAASTPAAGPLYFLTGPRPVRVAEFFGAYAGMLGARPRSVPSVVLRGVGGVADGTSRLGLPVPFGARTLEYVTRTGGVSRAAAARDLGWEPVVGLPEGMARCQAWLRAEGLLPAG